MSLLIMTGSGLNCILDPIMIFGLIGFPKLGIQGAALAIVISEVIVTIIGFYIIYKKYNLFTFNLGTIKKIIISWRRILYIGVPSTLSAILNPISAGIIIKIVSNFGKSAVAAVGVGNRIEMFAFMIPMTVGMSLVPFVAQNYGARRIDRIMIARKGTIIFALTYGLFIATVFLFIAYPMAKVFSYDQEVINILVHYIYITCFGYGFLEVHRYTTFFL